jgi:hypothetical protein
MKQFTITSLALCLFSIGGISAQPLMEFNNRHLGISTDNNPAFLPQYGFNMGLFSSAMGRTHGLSLPTLFDPATTAENTIRDFIQTPGSQFGAEFNVRAGLNLGFGTKKSYFTFSQTVNGMTNTSAPKDMLGLIAFGNAEYYGKTADLDFSGTSLMSYAESKFSFGRAVSNKLNVGISYSKLNGLMHMELDEAYARILTLDNQQTIYEIQSSAALSGRSSLLGIDANQLTDSGYDAQGAITDALNSGLGNNGSAWGLGAVYRANEKWRFSASAKNLGATIKWDMAAQTHNMGPAQWTWTGLDTSITSQLKDSDPLQVVTDSIKAQFTRTTTDVASYETKLHTQWILGAEYFISPRAQIQVVGGSGLGIKGNQSFTQVTYHQEWKEILDFVAGVGVFGWNSEPNIISSNLGASLNLGPVQVWGRSQFSSAYDYLAFSAGANINIGMRKDADHDGVPNKRDSCHQTFGVRSNNGCPLGYIGPRMTYEITVPAGMDSSAVQYDERNMPVVYTEMEIEPIEGAKAPKEKKKKSKKVKTEVATTPKKKEEPNLSDIMKN